MNQAEIDHRVDHGDWPFLVVQAPHASTHKVRRDLRAYGFAERVDVAPGPLNGLKHPDTVEVLVADHTEALEALIALERCGWTVTLEWD